MTSTEDLVAENQRLKEQLARMSVLALFSDLNMRVVTDPNVEPNPEQINRVKTYHENRWAQLEAMPNGDDRKDVAVRFARLIRSALEARTITAVEAQTWIERVRPMLG